MTTNKLWFCFKKQGDDWKVYGFRKNRFDNLRIFDDDRQSLTSHQTLWNIPRLRDTVESSTSPKIMEVSLTDQALYTTYVTGTLSRDFDAIEAADARASHHSSTENLNSTIRDFMRITQEQNTVMLRDMTTQLAEAIGRKDTQRMNIGKFDGNNEEPNSFITMFERACDVNQWTTDTLKINNLKSCLVPNSAADKWFSSRILDPLELRQNWEEWKAAFIASFSQNRCETASRAIGFFYTFGPLMDFFYEKERLLKIAFPDLGAQSFISLVLLGLPYHLRSTALAMDIDDKTTLMLALQKLPAAQKQLRTEPTSRQSYQSKPTQRYDDRNVKPVYQTSFKKKDDPRTPPKQGRVTHVNDVDTVKPFVRNHDLEIRSVMCNGVPVNAMFDSCASRDLISRKLVKSNGWQTKPDHITITGVNSAITLKESIDVIVEGKFDSNTLPKTKVKAFVHDRLSTDILLSNKTLKRMQIALKMEETAPTDIIPEDLATLQEVMLAEDASPDPDPPPIGKPFLEGVRTMDGVKTTFPRLFRPSPQPKHQVPFLLKEDYNLVQSKHYRLSRNKYAWVLDKIQDLKAKGFISDSKSKWASPVVVVPKESGEFRLCVDYRALNRETVLDPFPFPIIDDVITNLGGCSFFSKIDLKDGFHQLGLTPETRQFTAFVTPMGHFEWNVLPFGWMNSPCLFQRFMTNVVLSDLLHDRRVSVYVDDIIIGATSMKECQELTFRVLERLNLHGLTINSDKCDLHVPKVTFLGRCIDGTTRTTREESVEKVRQMSRPVDLHTLRVFLGLTGHFQGYIKDYSSIVRPLNRLKKKDVPFEWSEECESAFKSLVEIISSNPVLSFPDWKLKFELCCDASHLGTGSILYQRDPTLPKKTQLRVIGYQSHTFSSAEINYPVTDKECLAVKLAVGYFQSYLEAKPFLVHTDHQALSNLMSMTGTKGRLARWQMSLMGYDMTINHRKGSELQDADAISRLCLDLNPVNMVTAGVDLTDHATRKLILKRYHDDPDSGGHDGFLRTHLKIKSRFQWKGMRTEISRYVASCHDCQMKKFKYRPKHDFLVLPPHSKVAYETVHLDYGEIRKKAEGVKTTQSFILLIDEATRMVYTKAMSEKTRSLTGWLDQLPFRSYIQKVVTDNGPSFTSKEFKEWIDKNNIKHILSAQYHPQSNSMAERMMRDIKQFFALFPDFKQGWKKCLEAATDHHNRSYNSSLGCSPRFKLHRIPALFPADEEFGITVDQLKDDTPFSDEEVQAKRVKVQNAINASKSRIPVIKPGDEIIFQAGRDHKGPHVKGPVVVDEVITKDSVSKTMIVNDDGKRKAIALNNALPYKRRVVSPVLCLCVVSLCCIMQPSLAVFSRESPVIWLRSQIPVLDQFLTVNHTLAFQSLCTPFREARGLPTETYRDLNIWCNQRTDDALLPLELVCELKRAVEKEKEYKTRKPKRRRRFVFTTIVVLTVLTAIISTYVVIGKNHWDIADNQVKIAKLRKENLENWDHIKTLAKDLYNVTLRLDELEVVVKDFIRNNPNTSTLISDTSTAFGRWHTITTKMAREMKHERLPEELFDFYGGKLPENAIIKDAMPMGCVLEKKARLVRLEYQLPLEKVSHTLFEAQHFWLLKNYTDLTSNKTVTCKVIYNGPKFAISSPKCVHSMDSTATVVGRMSFIFDEDAPCVNATESASQNYWSKDETSCVPIGRRFPAQVLPVKQGSYVYCFGWILKMKGFEFQCPKFVFFLNRDVSFFVGRHYYDNRVININVTDMSVADHLRIISHLYPNFNDDPILKDLEKLEAELENPPDPFFDFNFYRYSFIAICVVLLFLFLLILWCYCTKRTGKIISRSREIVSRSRSRMRTKKSGSKKKKPIYRSPSRPRSTDNEDVELSEVGGFIDE